VVGDREIVQMDTGMDLLPGWMREWDGDPFFGTWLATSCQKNDWT
jgi:hypothetical protein